MDPKALPDVTEVTQQFEDQKPLCTDGEGAAKGACPEPLWGTAPTVLHHPCCLHTHQLAGVSLVCPAHGFPPPGCPREPPAAAMSPLSPGWNSSRVTSLIYSISNCVNVNTVSAPAPDDSTHSSSHTHVLTLGASPGYQRVPTSCGRGFRHQLDWGPMSTVTSPPHPCRSP